MQVLISGANGFLGSHLSRGLSAAGHGVWALVRESAEIGRLEPLGASVRIARMPADSSNLQAMLLRLRPDAIVHTACCYGRTGETWSQLVDANIRFGVELLGGVSAPYTLKPVLFINFDSALPKDVNAYTITKHQFAEWGRWASESPGNACRFVNLRTQHIYGPGDDGTKFATRVARACLTNVPSLALTAGEQRRDFVHVDDVVAATRCVLASRDRLPAHSEFDLGSGQAVTVREFAQTVHALAASTTTLDFGAVPYRPNEPMDCEANPAGLRALGWRPEVTLRDGLARMLASEGRP